MVKKKKKRTFDKNAKIAKRGEENCLLIGEGRQCGNFPNGKEEHRYF